MATKVKEGPIIFDADSVRAILDGRKTQTRRVIKPALGPEAYWMMWEGQGWRPAGLIGDIPDAARDRILSCPHGVPGDRLWVREGWSPWADEMTRRSTTIGSDDPCVYRSDFKPNTRCLSVGGSDVYWSSPIYMPRKFCRILLEVTDVRVERVQEISIYDIRDEGLDIEGFISGFEVESDGAADGCEWDNPEDFVDAARDEFKVRWDSINGRRPGYTWIDNPFVWVIEFKVLEGGA